MRRAAASAGLGLSESGVEPRHRVLLTGRNTADLVCTLLGLIQLGTSVVLADPTLPPARLRRLALDAGVDHVVADPAIGEAMAATGDPTAPRCLPSTVPPGPRRVGVGAELDLAAWSARRDALVVCTSGSTGAPRAVVRSGRSVVANTARTAAVMGYRPSDVLAPLLPYSHQYGMSLVLLAATTGAGLLVAPSDRLDLALPAVAEHRATVVDATPATYRMLLRRAARRPALAATFGAVRMWCTGGAPLDEALAGEFAAVTGRALLDGYGTSELGNVALAAPGGPARCLPLPGVVVSVVDERGDGVDAGTVGEVRVDSPDRATGYLRHGRLHAEAPGPLRTGDLGCLDRTGALRVIGRSAAVHRNGHTLYPDQIAAAASFCGALAHVVPVPDGDHDVRLVLFVEDGSGVDHHVWWRRLRDVLGRHELPNRVVVLERFPLTGSGKVDRRRLGRLAGLVAAPAPDPAPSGAERDAPIRSRARLEATHGG